MATSVNRILAAAPDQNPHIFRSLINLLRNSFSTSAPSPTAENPSDNNTSNKPKKKKRKNLIEVAQFLPNWGIGYHMAKAHWSGVLYQIAKINLYKDGRHGKAWGIVHKDGLPAADAPKKISGVHKRCWKYITSLSKAAKRMPVLSNKIGALRCCATGALGALRDWSARNWRPAAVFTVWVESC